MSDGSIFGPEGIGGMVCPMFLGAPQLVRHRRNCCDRVEKGKLSELVGDRCSALHHVSKKYVENLDIVGRSSRPNT